jgi:phospholipase C
MKKISAILALLIITSILLVGSITTAELAIASSPSFSNTTFPTATPIKHFVLLYQENNSFDHYFGTYPNATNPAGEPKFVAEPHTPSINGLLSAGLLTNNPNSANPFRLDRSQEITCDMNHGWFCRRY